MNVSHPENYTTLPVHLVKSKNHLSRLFNLLKKFCLNYPEHQNCQNTTSLPLADTNQPATKELELELAILALGLSTISLVFLSIYQYYRYNDLKKKQAYYENRDSLLSSEDTLLDNLLTERVSFSSEIIQTKSSKSTP